MAGRLEGKVAAILGAGPGIGRATAVLLAQEGARLGLLARGRRHQFATAELVAEAGGEAMPFAGDATVRAEVERFIGAVEGRYGRLDILVNNAGGSFLRERPFSEADPAELDRALANNVRSAYLATLAAVPSFRRAGGGSIVNVAAAFRVRQDGNAYYAAAKAAVVGLTENLARELQPLNIRVNCVCPGLIRIPQGGPPVRPRREGPRLRGTPEDVAFAMLYLASDESAWVTGHALVVDGGVSVFAGVAYER